MEKYLITFNEIEVISITPHMGGNNVVTGTNAIITTLDKAVIALDAMSIDVDLINQKIIEENV